MVREEFGPAEEEVVRTLMQLGHARVSDLVQAFGFQSVGNSGTSSNGLSAANGHGGEYPKGAGNVRSLRDLHAVLGRLVIAEIVDQVGPKTFRNPDDIYREIEDELNKGLPGEKSTAKAKEKMRETVNAQFQGAREESKKLKRHLNQTMPLSVKRRKLGPGVHAQASNNLGDISEIDPHVVLKVNVERCLVDLRNLTLSRFATDSLGPGSGAVYHAALRLLSDKASRCRTDPRISGPNGAAKADDDDANGHVHAQQQVSITSIQLYEALDPSVDLSTGIGRASKDKLDSRSAEKIRPNRPKMAEDSDESEDEAPARNTTRRAAESDSETGDDDPFEGDSRGNTAGNTRRGTRVTFNEDAVSKETRFDQMRQHLLLLAQSKQGFLRHCGTQGRGQWTVDFDLVVNDLRRTEADAVIEQTFGRHGLRLARILRGKGKLDEKTLPALALMKKGDVQGKMLALQMSGFVDVQEVPRDNSRLANRTMFFWFFDEERVQSRLVDDYYKTMLRCLQTLDVQRHRERDILTFVERKDVRGKEEEVMTAEHYDKYSQFLGLQKKLLGHVMRLDELISIFRDF